MKAFFDTNILVYAQLSEPRGDVARGLLADGGSISVQVLNEFANVLRKKLGREWRSIIEAIEDVCQALDPPAALTLDTHRAALGLARDHGFAFYDAVIVASALETGCDTLLTEDMQHGRTIGTLTIRNPFERGR